MSAGESHVLANRGAAGASAIIGSGVIVHADDDNNNLADNGAHTLVMNPDTAGIVKFDDHSFYTDASPSRLTIPATPAIARVVVWGYCVVQAPTVQQGEHKFHMSLNNFESFDAAAAMRVPVGRSGFSTFMTINSGPVVVSPGDFFQLHFTPTGVGQVTDVSSIQFGLYVIK